MGETEQTASTTQFKDPQRFGGGAEFIESIAAKVAKKLEYRPGDDLEPIVAKLGGEIRYLEYNDWERTADGSIEVSKKGDGSKPHFVINIASFSGPLRDRFTIAHELGHYILHSRVGKVPIQMDRFAADTSSDDPVEWEANWFAAGFLMPEEAFRKAWEDLGHDLFMVASLFRVSEQAAQIRKRVLKLT